ncbi:MAG: putative RNA polymerase sigma factor, partial [Candidatus Paceibacteria bacterium]
TGQINAALSAYDAAIALSTNETERAFLAGRKARARLELTT